MSSLTLLYLITITVSIGIAFLLLQLSKQSSAASFKVHKSKDGMSPATMPSLGSSGATVLFHEISGFLDPSQSRGAAGKKIEEIFNKEVEKKVQGAAQELKKKYESIISERTQSEEIAWEKYKKVFADKQETEAVVRSLADGVVVVNSDGKVVMLNPAAEKMLGFSMKDKLGKSILEDIKEEQLVTLSKMVPGQKDKEIEVVSRDDETKKVLRASSAVIENESGATVGMVSILSDVTKQKELDRLKSDFLAKVTHELRTPLVAVDNSLYLLTHENAGPITPDQKKFLVIAERNLKRLKNLIDDLLDLAKLEAGKLPLKCVPCRIDKVIDDSVESLSLWAKTKSITFEKKISEGLSEIDIDPGRITQVFVNLIGNAIKFIPKEGRITIEAKPRPEENAVEITVADTGIGIPRENLQRIFDKFYQVSGGGSVSDLTGTGIGLSVSKELIELHGGRIWAESEKGEGTRFIFILPVKQREHDSKPE